MDKYTNESGKECYRGVTDETAFTGEEFHKPEYQPGDDEFWAFHTNLGSLTVVDRMTGYGYRDVESAFRDPDGNFWLASCQVDVRLSGCGTVGDAISYIKEKANTCIPDRDQSPPSPPV